MTGCQLKSDSVSSVYYRLQLVYYVTQVKKKGILSFFNALSQSIFGPCVDWSWTCQASSKEISYKKHC